MIRSNSAERIQSGYHQISLEGFLAQIFLTACKGVDTCCCRVLYSVQRRRDQKGQDSDKLVVFGPKHLGLIWARDQAKISCKRLGRSEGPAAMKLRAEPSFNTLLLVATKTERRCSPSTEVERTGSRFFFTSPLANPVAVPAGQRLNFCRIM